MAPSAPSSVCSILKGHIKITKLSNFNVDAAAAAAASGSLFIRCFIFAGGGRRIRFETKEVPAAAAKGPCWDELISIESRGASPAMREVLERKLVFELRRRKNPAATSKLLGRAEVAWKDVLLGAPERRIAFAAPRSKVFWAKTSAQPSLLVEMRAQLVAEPPPEKKKTMIKRAAMVATEGCECEHCCGWSLTEDDMLLAATLINTR